MKKIFPLIVFVIIIVIIFLSLAKKEQMITVYQGNLSQKPLELKLHHLQDPECKMVVESKEYSAQIAAKDGKTWVFDDIGCLILWLKDKDFPQAKIWVYSLDTHEWIDTKKAYFSIDEITPMRHGFGAYKHKQNGMIGFDEVRDRVLRGEDLTNPIIRKKVLGR